MAFGDSRSSEELPFQRGYNTFQHHNSNQFHPYHEYSAGSSALRDLIGSGYNGYDNYGYHSNTSHPPLHLALEAGYGQSLQGSRSRDRYRTLIGIPPANGQDGYEQHSLDSSLYQDSSSNVSYGGGGGTKIWITLLQYPPPPQPRARAAAPARKRGVPASPQIRQRGLRRHTDSTHADENTALYTCKCNYYTSIKSNYQRHLNKRLNSRCGGRDDIWGCFMCKCGCASFEDLDEHSKHLGVCDAVKEKVGRPKKH
ncbi:hypothetical protein PG994_002802 [Apiospora phragmitis]|uniref:C2H2-type domain-containing protein n=1 Tax=Apiospora phragmitis TaxID=2905665 RepID=A0ABR1W922_9PEZI